MNRKSNNNISFARFAPCVSGVGLLMIFLQAAGCALAGETWKFSPVGFGFSDDFKPAPPGKNKFKGCDIFRGKVALPKTQTKNKSLEERTLSAPNS